ncbi:MAG: GNAT family N-acetyltransferase [Candidatus Phosphoribacter sp.]
MSGPQVHVRKADERSFHAVCALWAEQREERGITDTGPRKVTPEAIKAALDRRDTVAFVAISKADTVGYVVLSDCSLNPFADSGCVAVEQLFVTRAARKQGVARALMAAVATYADRQGAEQVASNVPSGGREANRFFARLGFTPHTVRRLTTTTSLQRRLLDDESGARFALDQLLARRRVVRLRAARERPTETLST